MKLSKCLVGMMLLTTSASSLAAFDRVTTTSGSITFTAPTYPVTTTITPVANLTSGQLPGNTKIAEIAFSSSQPQRIAYRWGPATGNFQSPSNRIGIATITGNSNATNQLKVLFDNVTGSTPISDGSTFWMTTDTQVASFRNNIITDVARTVNPDVYTVYIESGVYVP